MGLNDEVVLNWQPLTINTCLPLIMFGGNCKGWGKDELSLSFIVIHVNMSLAATLQRNRIVIVYINNRKDRI